MDFGNFALPIHDSEKSNWIGRCLDQFFKQRKRPALNTEVGSTLIEFAFVLMILLMLTFGMIDLGRAVYTANILEIAAQTGARAGLIDLAAVKPAVQNRLIGLNPAKAQITAKLVGNERVEVEVTYPFELITPLLSQLVKNGGIQLSASTSMLVY